MATKRAKLYRNNSVDGERAESIFKSLRLKSRLEVEFSEHADTPYAEYDGIIYTGYHRVQMLAAMMWIGKL